MGPLGFGLFPAVALPDPAPDSLSDRLDGPADREDEENEDDEEQGPSRSRDRNVIQLRFVDAHPRYIPHAIRLPPPCLTP